MKIKNLLDGDITQQDLLNYYNATITETNLPSGINGFVFCYRGINNIFIKKTLTKKKKKQVILHELAHIELNQFNQINADLFAFMRPDYEDEADNYLKGMNLDGFNKI